MDEFVAPDALKVACESLLKSLGPDALVLLASASDDNTKVAIVCAAGDDAVKKGLNAGKICGATAKACGGGGGGKPNFAQAGGRDASNLAEALAAAKPLREPAPEREHDRGKEEHNHRMEAGPHFLRSLR